MISKDNLVNVGYISRPHSFKGEIQVSLNKKVALNKSDFIFLRIEGQFIPYKILQVKGKESEPILELEFIKSFEYAQEVTGTEVFINISKVQAEETEISFIGYEVIDSKLSTIGKVIDVQELPQQIMLVVNHQNKECLIPLVEDFIDYISEENKEIWLNLPDGILNIQ
jgi:16S rRNA processing protein RimM